MNSGMLPILQQICALNADIRICNRSTIEQIACQERSFRLALGFATLGNCELRAATGNGNRTKVITEDSDVAFPRQIISISARDFDEYCASELFWCIQKVVETLQDDATTSKGEVTIVLLPEQLSVTVCASDETRRTLLQRIADLPAIRNRSKRICSIPGEHRFYLLATEAQNCEASTSAEVIVRCDYVNAFGALIPDQERSLSFSISGNAPNKVIQSVNGQSVQQSPPQLRDGDILDVRCPLPVHAGGHHLNTRAPPSLPALSDFTARVEFMCDTNGWAASDEMYHYTQALQWRQNWLRFATPQMWDVSKGDFEEPVFGELDIPNNATTAIPVLIGSHWAGIEITRRGTETSVTFVQVPTNLHTALTFLVARLIDVAPHRFQVQCEFNDPQPHTCGWDLIFRWYRRHGIHQGIADISNHMQLNDEYNDLIQTALQCSSEDWAMAQINFEVGQLAFSLRKNFLFFLARREWQGRPHQQVALFAACRPPAPQLGAVPAAQNAPFVPHPLQLNRTQLTIDRIRHRLIQILLHPGWLSSDELDIALEGPRAMNPQTLFCPPSSWNVGSSSLRFFNDYIPDYRAYNQVIWIIEVDRHWVQAEAYLHEDASNFAFTFPVDSHIRLQPLVDHLINVTLARDTQLSIHFYDQRSPMHMCGFQLVAQIFHRLAANTVPLQATQRRQLSFHSLAADLDRAHVEARAVWTNAGADPHFIDFAANIRQWFLIRVAENRFPAEYTSAGANNQQDVTMQPADGAAALLTLAKLQAHPVRAKIHGSSLILGFVLCLALRRANGKTS